MGIGRTRANMVWLWVSNESWGDVPYHYGRWVFDPREGWLWVPGYVWGPSWVVWRSGGGNIGWFPMPPGDNYYGDGAYRDNFDNEYGYRDWYGPSFGNEQFLSLWIFVGEDHFARQGLPQLCGTAARLWPLHLANHEIRPTTSRSTIMSSIAASIKIDCQAAQAAIFQPVAASTVIRPQRRGDASRRRPSDRAARTAAASYSREYQSRRTTRTSQSEFRCAAAKSRSGAARSGARHVAAEWPRPGEHKSRRAARSREYEFTAAQCQSGV